MKKQTLAELLRAPLCCTALWFSFAALPAGAQTTPTGTAAEGATSPAVTPTAAEEESVVVLDPFVVSAEEDAGSYRATSTLAGTRVRTDLKDVASSISVVTAQFMKDTGATNNESLLVYTTNTEVGGVGGNFSGTGNTFSQGITEQNSLLRPSQNTRVRGLDSADNTRDYFTSDIPWDSYIVGRVDLQRGPNSILFGLGSPAGIVNSSINTAEYRDAAVLENRIGRFGSLRTSVDINQELIKNEVAVRFAALDDNTKYRQKPAYNHDRRIFGAVSFDPKWFGETATINFRANVESGDVKANRPRTLPPIDKITPWFTTGETNRNAMNKLTMDPYYAWQYGALAAGPAWRNVATDYSHWIQPYMMDGMQITANPIFVYEAGSPTPIMTPYQAAPNAYWALGTFDSNGDSTRDTVYRDAGIAGYPFARSIGVAGDYWYSQYAGLPAALTGVWKDRTLSDNSTYDFFNRLIDGPTKGEMQNWTAANIVSNQTFFGGRLATQLAYDHQDYSDGAVSNFGFNNPTISVDINSYMMDYPAMVGAAIEGQEWHSAYPTAATAPDGYTGPLAVENPNVGRAFVGASARNNTGQSTHSVRDTYRAQAVGLFKASDFLGENTVADILGSHTVNGLYSVETNEVERRSWARYAMEIDWALNQGTGTRLSDGSRVIDWMAYISDDLRSATSAKNLHLSPISARQSPAGSNQVRYYDSHYTNLTVDPLDAWENPTIAPWDTANIASYQAENPANYGGWKTGAFNVLNSDEGDKNQLYVDGSKIERKITSSAVTWQGKLWDDTIVPTVGYRRDVLRQRSGTAPLNEATGSVMMDYDADSAWTESTGDTTSWGVVVHTPKMFRDKLPFGTNIDLFMNQSDNTRVETRFGFDGAQLPNTTGKTKDYGFAVSTLEDRLQVKVTWFETEVKNASIAYGEAGTLGANTYYLYLLESWGLGRTMQDLVGLARGPQAAGWSPWASPDSGWAVGGWDIGAVLQDASTDDNINTIKAWLQNMPSQSFFDAYGFDIDRNALSSINVDSLIANGTGASITTTVNAGTPQAATYINAIGGWSYGSQGVGDIQAVNRGRISGVWPQGLIDNISKGVEIEVSGQPIKNLNVSLNVSKTTATRTEIGQNLVDTIENDYRRWVGQNPENPDLDLLNADGSTKLTSYWDNVVGGSTLTADWSNGRAVATGHFRNAADNHAPAGDIRLWWAGDGTIRQYFLNNIWAPYQFQLQASRAKSMAPELNPWRVNLVTNYNFSSGPLNGSNIGVAYRWQDGNILGYELNEVGTALDVSKPYWGKSQDALDMWVGYGRKLTQKLNWRVQLNLRNVGDKVRLVPLSVQPDGTVATSRIAEGMTWQVTNTFSF